MNNIKYNKINFLNIILFMNFLTKLEKLALLLLVIFIFFYWEHLLSRYSFTKIFDFGMAAFFWAFTFCCAREEKIDLNKALKEEPHDPLKVSLINSYDILVLFIIVLIKLIYDFYPF